jgi:hypothetical protein
LKRKKKEKSSKMSASSFGLKKPSQITKSPNHTMMPTTQQQSAPTQKSIIEIYTDWANHYLDKLHGGRKKVKDLQKELQDGIILAEVIEAVMGARVPDIVKKPKSHAQMVDNIQHSLNFLAKKGVNISDIQAKGQKISKDILC